MSTSDREVDPLLVDLLTSYDEVLACGSTSSPSGTPVPPDLQHLFNECQEVLQLLEELWPRGAAPVPPELKDHPRYRVLEMIGRGGMGAVYKAKHQLMDRVVALKVLRKGMTDNPDAVQRFQREVRAAARLTHPNIVTSHDA